MIRVLGLSLYGSQAASHRVRLSQFQQGLARESISLEMTSLLDNDYLQRSFAGRRPSFRGLISSYFHRLNILSQSDRFDLAIVHCELLPFFPSWLELPLLKTPFIYDLDDAFYLKYRAKRFQWLQPLLGSKSDQMMAAAVAVTAGSSELASYARCFNTNVTLLPSVVDTEHFLPSYLQPPALPVAPFTVGWVGTPSTAPYLQPLVEPLQQLALERPVRLVVVGGPPPRLHGVEVVEYPWSLNEEVALIQQFDVGVMPLPDSLWARGKCAYKLIQYMACGIPVIASPVGANLDAVPPSCGLLASSPAEWLSALRQLSADYLYRQRLANAARQWVEQRYSLRSALPVLTGVISKATAGHTKA